MENKGNISMANLGFKVAKNLVFHRFFGAFSSFFPFPKTFMDLAWHSDFVEVQVPRKHKCHRSG